MQMHEGQCSGFQQILRCADAQETPRPESCMEDQGSTEGAICVQVHSSRLVDLPQVGVQLPPLVCVGN